MTTRDELAARVPDREKRLEAARLYQASLAADEARDEDPAVGALNDKYEPLYAALDEEFQRRRQQLRAQEAAEAGALDLNTKAEAAQKAYDDFDASALLIDEDGEIERCTVTGLPLYEDDAVLEDTTTGEKVLKVVLGVPLDEGDLSFFIDGEAEQKAA
jgi:hypothetical protein